MAPCHIGPGGIILGAPKHAKFQPKRWPLFIVVIAFAALTVAGTTISLQNPRIDTLAVTNVPTVNAVPIPVSQARIAPSRVMNIFVPSVGINNEVLQLDSCRNGIAPPVEGSYIAAVYQCSDYENPSSASTSVSVLTGHSSCKVDTVLNKLNDHKSTLVGQEVLIKTETSGNSWLVYRIETVEEPRKQDLGNSERIWGSTEISTANQLNLITCLLGDCADRSTNNLVAIARFVEVR